MARKVKSTPKAATDIKKDTKPEVKENIPTEDKPVEVPVSQPTSTTITNSDVKTESKVSKKSTKSKRKFTIYYDNAIIPKVYVYGDRPKQAAYKAFNIILKHFFTKDKKLALNVIGKEIKFYIEETIKTDTVDKTNQFYYKGSRNYIVTKDTIDNFNNKKVKVEKDSEGIYCIVAEHKGANGEVKRIMHKFINKINIDKDATIQARLKKQEEIKLKKKESRKNKKSNASTDVSKPEDSTVEPTTSTTQQTTTTTTQVSDVKVDKPEEVKKSRKRKQC